MVNKTKYGTGRKFQLVTCITRDQRKYILELVGLVTQSKTIQEFLSPALARFLEIRPWENKDWVWETGSGYWVAGPNGEKVPSDTWVSYNPSISDFNLPDGTIISGEALVNKLDKVAIDFCFKNNGTPNKQKTAYNFIKWVVEDLYPESKYRHLIPEKIKPLEITPSKELLLSEDSSASIKSSPRLMRPKGVTSGVTVVIKLSPMEQAVYKRIGAIDWLRKTLAFQATAKEIQLNEDAREAFKPSR